MRIREIPYTLTERRDPTRSEGVHVSNLIREIALASGTLKPEYAADKNTIHEVASNAEVELPLRIACGLAWEGWISQKHPEILYHPGELVVDGIHMSPDGVSFDDDLFPKLHEFKFTWKSSRREIAEEWMWISQMKAYLWGLLQTSGQSDEGTLRKCFHPVFLSRLHVLWANGDYRDSGPQYQIFEFEFGLAELIENWEMILRCRDRVEGKAPVKPQQKRQALVFMPRRMNND